MENITRLGIDINLANMQNAQVTEVNGKKILSIPLDDNDLSVNPRTNAIKLYLTAFPAKKEGYKSSHYVVQSFSKAFREKSEFERNRFPILGNITTYDNTGKTVNTGNV